MSERGYLLLADISGYTRFLNSSELDHANGIIEDLLACMLEQVRPPLALSNIQGDCVFAYAPDASIHSSGQIIDNLEALYFEFRDRLTSIIDNTTCPCRACSNASELDLKLIVHHGEYAVQDLAKRKELAGSDVILVHRLLKNDVTERTGIAGYGLFTSAADSALGLDKSRGEARPYAIELDEFGTVEGLVIDFGGKWQHYHATHEIVVSDEELWFEPVSLDIPGDLASVYEAFCNPALQAVWNTATTDHRRINGNPEHLQAGAVDHCAHGREDIVFKFVDVRPLKHVTADVQLPFGGRGRWTATFESENGETQMTIRVARSTAPNPLARSVLALMGMLFMKRQVRSFMQTELELLRAYMNRAAHPPSR